MRIVVFGASGRTGRLVVAQAVERHHEVVAFVRDASKQWFPDAVKIRQGELRDVGSVERTLTGADAVVSALGPIAKVTETEISDSMRTIVDAMQRLGPRRLVIAANATVFTDDEVTGTFANVAAEHRRDAAILRASGLDWTVVAVPLLSDDPATGSFVAVVDGKGPGTSIARGDLAAALLDALGQDGWIRHVVGVTDPPAKSSGGLR